MTRALAVAILAFAGLAACGGDGDGGGGSSSSGGSGGTKPITKTMTISIYGPPIVSSSASTAAPGVAADTQATVQALQAALAAQGVAATVTPQVMTGTSLHTLVTVGSNGQPPTADQFKTDPSSYVLANFQLDDMVTPWMDLAQKAAAEQFKQDLEVFIQRMQAAGKQVGIVTPIATCDYPRGSSSYSVRNRNYTAVDALTSMNAQAVDEKGGKVVGALSYQIVWVQDPAADFYEFVNTSTQGHMGADCRTPDAYLRNLQIQSIAQTVATF